MIRPALRRPLTFLSLAACFVATVATSPAPPRWMTQTELEPEAVVLTAETRLQTRTVVLRTRRADAPANEPVLLSQHASFSPTYEAASGVTGESPWLEVTVRTPDGEPYSSELVRVNADGTIPTFGLYAFPGTGDCRDDIDCEIRVTMTFERDPQTQGTITIPWVLEASANGGTDSRHNDVPAGFKLELAVEP